MMKMLLGTKIGMTQIYRDNGKVVPVTLINVSGNKVVAHLNNKLPERSAQVEIGVGEKKNTNQAELGKYKQVGFVPKYRSVVTVNKDRLEGLGVGTELEPTVFEEGEKVDVVGVTKGKGFQGVVKRYGFKGGPKTHGGKSGKYRSPGSIGAGTTPGRVLKGKKMPGRMGADNQTVQNLEVAMIDEEHKVIGVRGSVPGHKGAYVQIKTPAKLSKVAE